jgi:SAM-dependent methyltransferase
MLCSEFLFFCLFRGGGAFKGVTASVFTYEQALAKYSEFSLNNPKPSADSRIYTLNNKGADSISCDYGYHQFLEFGSYAVRKFLEFGKGKKILEVGGCYGGIMLYALKQSETTQYTLNDLDERHLFIAAKKLSERINSNWLNARCTRQVKFIQADIYDTKIIKNFGLYDAIYVSLVFHFFTPAQFELAVKNLHMLLKPGGQIYITALSPYLNYFKKFIVEYEKRVKAGEKYPGFIEFLRDYFDVNDSTLPLQITNLLTLIRDYMVKFDRRFF